MNVLVFGLDSLVESAEWSKILGSIIAPVSNKNLYWNRQIYAGIEFVMRVDFVNQMSLLEFNL